MGREIWLGLQEGHWVDDLGEKVWRVVTDFDEVVATVGRRLVAGLPTIMPLEYAVLRTDIEQAPNPDSRVTLAAERDALGQRRVRLVGNLYVAGSPVFPTIGHANPTLTIVALALRLADHLKERLRPRAVPVLTGTSSQSRRAGDDAGSPPRVGLLRGPDLRQLKAGAVSRSGLRRKQPAGRQWRLPARRRERRGRTARR